MKKHVILFMSLCWSMSVYTRIPDEQNNSGNNSALLIPTPEFTLSIGNPRPITHEEREVRRARVTASRQQLLAARSTIPQEPRSRPRSADGVENNTNN